MRAQCGGFRLPYFLRLVLTNMCQECAKDRWIPGRNSRNYLIANRSADLQSRDSEFPIQGDHANGCYQETRTVTFGSRDRPLRPASAGQPRRHEGPLLGHSGHWRSAQVVIGASDLSGRSRKF